MIVVPLKYDREYLEYNRIQPVFSKKIINLIHDVIEGKVNTNFIDMNYPMAEEKYKIDLIDSFKIKILNKFNSSKLNSIKGLDSFLQIDVCLGCTQYIDNLYLLKGKDGIQVLSNEYRYHFRLYPDAVSVDYRDLVPEKDLIISLPFVTGNKHLNMDEILSICHSKDIKVHLDCAWLSAAKNIDFNFNHPAIESVGLSLSKGYGLGWNRIGVRLSRNYINDSIKIMNDFQMIPNINICFANYFLDNIEVDHLWNEHSARYEKICKDFNLTPTQSIHVARDNNQIVGVCDLIRYLELNND